MIIDTHCHYNLSPLAENWSKHWQTAQDHGVEASIVVGTDLSSCKKATEIAKQENKLKTAIGVHPHEFSELKFSVIKADLTKLISQNKDQVVAIGETGLDFFRTTDGASKENQIQAFLGHLELAEKFKLPAIIHVRDKEVPEEPTQDNAYWQVAKIIESQIEAGKLKHGFVLHCLSGPKSYVEKLTQLGAYCGIAANVTYKNADHLRHLVNLIPHDRLLAETDAPFLPPQEFRGKTCEPWMIEKTVGFLESELNINPTQLIKNSKQLFRI